MLSRYWSRAEYELVLERHDNELWLKPWVGCRNVEEVKINVTDNEFWQYFANNYDRINWWDDEAKIDIYDQLKVKWHEFVDYCWTYRHKYERIHRKV